MKIASWNVNGIRSVTGKGFEDWFRESKCEIVCVQEIKAFEAQVDDSIRHPLKFNSYWKSAKKPGYSGVAIYSKREPEGIREGLGVSEFDDEGRVLIADFPDFSLVNAYFPNSQRDHARLDYKLRFCETMRKFLKKEVSKGRNVILCGDYNIAHQEIDLKNPKSNENNAGFLPEERAWMTEFLSQGFKDTFREIEKGPGHYTWWSYRPGVREKNIGWRLDYHCVNEEFFPRVKKTIIQPDVKGSDHCPVVLELR